MHCRPGRAGIAAVFFFKFKLALQVSSISIPQSPGVTVPGIQRARQTRTRLFDLYLFFNIRSFQRVSVLAPHFYPVSTQFPSLPE